jgi:hypothetical protein
MFMKLPPVLLGQFRTWNGGDPAVVARSIYDIKGDLGETLVAANQSALTFFSRPPLGEFQAFQLTFNDIRRLSCEADGAFALLSYETAGKPRRTLKFSAWDHRALAAMVSLWETATGLKSGHAPEPLVLFCAAMHAAMASDISVDAAEMQFLASRIADSSAIEEGGCYFETHGLDALLTKLGRVLNPVQKRCLLANLVEVTILDGVLRLAEQEVVERFRLAMAIDEADFRRISAVLIGAKNSPSSAGADADEVLSLMNNVAVFSA